MISTKASMQIEIGLKKNLGQKQDKKLVICTLDQVTVILIPNSKCLIK